MPLGGFQSYTHQVTYLQSGCNISLTKKKKKASSFQISSKCANNALISTYKFTKDTCLPSTLFGWVEVCLCLSDSRFRARVGREILRKHLLGTKCYKYNPKSI